MKKVRRKKADELCSSYQREDFPKGLVRGKYAARLVKTSNIVRLDPEIHAAFAKAAGLTKRSGGRSKTRDAER